MGRTAYLTENLAQKGKATIFIKLNDQNYACEIITDGGLYRAAARKVDESEVIKKQLVEGLKPSTGDMVLSLAKTYAGQQRVVTHKEYSVDKAVYVPLRFNEDTEIITILYLIVVAGGKQSKTMVYTVIEDYSILLNAHLPVAVCDEGSKGELLKRLGYKFNTDSILHRMNNVKVLSNAMTDEEYKRLASRYIEACTFQDTEVMTWVSNALTYHARQLRIGTSSKNHRQLISFSKRVRKSEHIKQSIDPYFEIDLSEYDLECMMSMKDSRIRYLNLMSYLQRMKDERQYTSRQAFTHFAYRALQNTGFFKPKHRPEIKLKISEFSQLVEETNGLAAGLIDRNGQGFTLITDYDDFKDNGLNLLYSLGCRAGKTYAAGLFNTLFPFDEYNGPDDVEEIASAVIEKDIGSLDDEAGYRIAINMEVYYDSHEEDRVRLERSVYDKLSGMRAENERLTNSRFYQGKAMLLEDLQERIRINMERKITDVEKELL